MPYAGGHAALGPVSSRVRRPRLDPTRSHLAALLEFVPLTEVERTHWLDPNRADPPCDDVLLESMGWNTGPYGTSTGLMTRRPSSMAHRL